MHNEGSPGDDAETHEKCVAYLISTRLGIAPFIRREIEEVERCGIRVCIFSTTRHGSSPFTEARRVYTLRGARGLRSDFIALSRYRARYLRGLFQALRGRSFLAFILGARLAVGLERTSISHVHSHMGGRKILATYFANRLSGTTYSATLHAHELYPPWQHHSLSKEALERATLLVTISDFNAGRLRRELGVNREVTVIRCVRPAVEYTPTPTGKTPIILTACLPSERKGLDVLAKAMTLLSDLEFEWRIAGIGERHGGRIIGRILKAAPSVEARTKFLGYISSPELNREFSQSSVFALTPLSVRDSGGEVVSAEGMPYSVIEAMAHGRAICTTRHAGIPETVEGDLSAEGDVSAIAARLRELLEKPENRQHEGLRNYKRVMARHGADQLAPLVTHLSARAARTHEGLR